MSAEQNTKRNQRHRLGSIGAFVAGREAVTFFALTLALSWALWVPGAAGLVDFGSLTIVVITVGGFGPLVAAAIVTWLVGHSLRAWAGQVLRWRVHPVWYLLALLTPLLTVAATTLVYAALGNPIQYADAIQQVPTYAVPVIFLFNMVFVFLLGGGQEELGWRGFALPHLLERYDAVGASLIIGAVWAVWHLPLFAVEGSGQYGAPFAPYVVSLLAGSILFTWLYRSTGRSVLLAMILHASHNSSGVFLPIPNGSDTLRWISTGVIWVIALGLIAVYGRDLRAGGTEDREPVGERSHSPSDSDSD